MSEATQATSEAVKDAIERDGVIKNGLARGLINTRALARYIQVETGERYSFDAILSAVRRHPVKENAAKYQLVGKMISKLAMKDEMVVITMKNTSDMPAYLTKFSAEVDHSRGETLYVVSSASSILVVIDSKNLHRLLAIVPKNNLKETRDRQAEIVLSLTEESVKAPGVVATISTELAMNGIALTTILSGPILPRALIVLLPEMDALKAYQLLERLKNISTKR